MNIGIVVDRIQHSFKRKISEEINKSAYLTDEGLHERFSAVEQSTLNEVSAGSKFERKQFGYKLAILYFTQFDAIKRSSNNTIGPYRQFLEDFMQNYTRSLENLPNLYTTCLKYYYETMNKHFAENEEYFGTNRLIIIHHTVNYQAMAKVYMSVFIYL